MKCGSSKNNKHHWARITVGVFACMCLYESVYMVGLREGWGEGNKSFFVRFPIILKAYKTATPSKVF